jgi:O-antigen/teichoic acid export membrane protein
MNGGSAPGAGDATAETHREAVRGAARNSGWGAAGAAVAAVLGFVLVLLVARVAGAHQAGLFFAATAIVMVGVAVCAAGADTGLLWALSRDRAVGGARDLRALVTVALVPVAVIALVAGVLLALLAPVIAPMFGSSDVEQTATMLRVAALGIVLGPLAQCLVQATRGLGDVRPFVAVQQVGLPTLRVVAVIALALLGVVSVQSLAWAWVSPFALSLAVAGWFVARRIRSAERAAAAEPNPVTRTTIRAFWRFAAPRGLGSACSQALTWSDVLLVAILASPSVAAVYAAASRFASGGQIALQAMRLGIGPQVGAAFARGDVERVTVLYRASTTWAVMLSWPIFLTLAMFPDVALGIFGPEFVSGSTALVILALAMMFSVGIGNVGTVLLMSGNSFWAARNSAAALGVNIALNLALVPALGAVGAALSWMAAIVVENVLGLWLVHSRLGVAGHGRRFWLTAASVVVTLGLVALGCRVLIGADLVALVTDICISGLLLTVGVIVVRGRTGAGQRLFSRSGRKNPEGVNR